MLMDAGIGGVPPVLSSGMPGSRWTAGRRSAKVMDWESRTFTGFPARRVTSYSHIFTAAIAASSSPGIERVTRALATRPSSPIRTSRMTIPRVPAAAASAGYSGATYFRRDGTATSRPATFGALGSAGEACGAGEGACAAGAVVAGDIKAVSAAAIHREEMPERGDGRSIIELRTLFLVVARTMRPDLRRHLVD